MVIIESALVRRFLPDRMDAKNRAVLDRLTLGLGKGASVVLFTYFGLKVIALAHGNHWDLLGSSYGAWFSVEMLGFVLLPCFLFLYGVRKADARWVRWAALGTIVGVIANRLTVSMFAFNWQLPHREFFYWKEIVVLASIVTIEIVVYRWIVNRMPVHMEHPRYRGMH